MTRCSTRRFSLAQHRRANLEVTASVACVVAGVAVLAVNESSSWWWAVGVALLATGAMFSIKAWPVLADEPAPARGMTAGEFVRSPAQATFVPLRRDRPSVIVHPSSPPLDPARPSPAVRCAECKRGSWGLSPAPSYSYVCADCGAPWPMEPAPA